MKARLPQGYGGGGAANIQQLARQAQKIQDDMATVEKELEEKEYSATAGGNAVKVTVTGKMEVSAIELSPEVVDPEDVEMLQDLLSAAFNEATKKVDEMMANEMGKLTGGMGLPPGLF